MTRSDALDAGRAAFARKQWRDAYEQFTAAETQLALEPEDLDRLATAAYLIGEDAASTRSRTRAHAGFLERADSIGAARSALWIAFVDMEHPARRAQASGWLSRAQRLLDDAAQPCAERGWVLCAAARQRAAAGDFAAAHAGFGDAARIGEQFGDRDLLTLARHGQGRTLVMMNQTDAGLALLDEAMIAVAGGEIGPIVAGAVYCSVISACHDIFDLRRAHEWTMALQVWCDAQPDIVPFRGHCLVRRSELMLLHGQWDHAVEEARRACDRADGASPPPEVGAAYYQIAELHRLRGEVAKAEEAYRAASQAGRKPQPGLALLRLQQGQHEAAEVAIRLALQEARDTRTRVLLLAAAVEIALAGNDLPAARAASGELAGVADALRLPYPMARAAAARGAVALADGDRPSALDALQRACAGWQELGAPYEHAETRVLLGTAHLQCGDADGAELEFDAARDVFDRLGAAPAAARVARLARRPEASASTGLTGREVEVLRLIATGITNGAIASRLGISERTVDRHVSNIFTKLDLGSRAAATAYAYEHKLV